MKTNSKVLCVLSVSILFAGAALTGCSQAPYSEPVVYEVVQAEAAYEEPEPLIYAESTTYGEIEAGLDISAMADEFSALLSLRLGKNAVGRVLGQTPIRTYSEYSGRPIYRYDLMTIPEYNYISEFDSVDFAGLQAGTIGMIVFVIFDDGDVIAEYTIYYSQTDGAIYELRAGNRTRIMEL